MIYAEGIKDGNKMIVGYMNGKFLFNGKANTHYDLMMRYEMEQKHPIGGTFYPEKTNDIRNVINCIREYFFDMPVNVEISAEEIEPIPSEEGVVY